MLNVLCTHRLCGRPQSLRLVCENCATLPPKVLVAVMVGLGALNLKPFSPKGRLESRYRKDIIGCKLHWTALIPEDKPFVTQPIPQAILGILDRWKMKELESSLKDSTKVLFLVFVAPIRKGTLVSLEGPLTMMVRSTAAK